MQKKNPHDKQNIKNSNEDTFPPNKGSILPHLKPCPGEKTYTSNYCL